LLIRAQVDLPLVLYWLLISAARLGLCLKWSTPKPLIYSHVPNWSTPNSGTFWYPHFQIKQNHNDAWWVYHVPSYHRCIPYFAGFVCSPVHRVPRTSSKSHSGRDLFVFCHELCFFSAKRSRKQCYCCPILLNMHIQYSYGKFIFTTI
jgi:hypothetical protein